MEIEAFAEKHKELLAIEKSAEADNSLVPNEVQPVWILRKKKLFIPKLQLVGPGKELYGHIALTFQPYGSNGHEESCLPVHSISSGDVACIVKTYDDGKWKCLTVGVVCRVNSSSITITCDKTSEKASAVHPDQQYSLLKLVDDSTYKRMRKALGTLRAKAKNASDMVRVMFYRTPPSRLDPSVVCDLKFFNEDLNDNQKDAVKFALCQKEVSVIHGPPGTGKTTTVVEIILQLVKQGHKVLACGPSNVSVDNIVEKLSEYKIRMIRLGHPARSLLTAACHTLDAAVVQSHEGRILDDITREMNSVKTKLEKEENSARKAMFKSMCRNLLKEFQVRKEKLERSILLNSDVVLSTITSAHPEGSLRHLPSNFFNAAIIDECSQAIEASCWIPLLCVSRCIIAGDHFQLPPVINSVEAREQGLQETLMQRLTTFYGDAVTRMLTIQYRMNELIMNWPSRQLYDGKLKAHHSVASHLLKDLPNVEENENTSIPLLLIDTAHCDMHEVEDEEESKGNEGEASLVAVHVEALIKSGLSAVDIAVVTPYNFQVELIKSRLAEKYPRLEIKSVDSFQGREKEAVVLSLVRSNKEGKIGFLSEDRRINVAVTRARRHLAVVCNSETVSRHEFLKQLVEYMNENGEVRSAFAYAQEIEAYPGCGMSSSRSLPKEKASDTKDNEKRKKKKKVKGEKTQLAAAVSEKRDEACDKASESETGKRLAETKDAMVEKYTEIIKDFLSDEDSSLLQFSSSLSAFERRTIHEISEKFHLIHVSQGEGDERYIEVRKRLEESADQNCCNPTASADSEPPSESVSNVRSSPEKCLGSEPAEKCPKLVGSNHEKKKKVPKSAKSKQKSSPLEDNSLPSDDFDAVIEAARKENTTCAYLKCKESLCVSAVVRPCKFCRRQYCFKHLLPEVHGCGSDAKVHARQQMKAEFRSSQADVPNSRNTAMQLSRLLDTKLKQFSEERQRKQKSKR